MPYLMPKDEWDQSGLRRFGVALRRCRLRAGLSQVVLAERSAVSQSTISRLENGKAPAAPVYKLVRLGDVLGLDLPLAFCPHHHHCAWRPLLEDGREDHRHEPAIASDYLSSIVPELAPFTPERGMAPESADPWADARVEPVSEDPPYLRSEDRPDARADEGADLDDLDGAR